MKKQNNKTIDKLTSKLLKETLEEKANNLMSEIEKLNELGGMEDQHDIFGEMTPEQLDFISSLSDDELRTFLTQKRKGVEHDSEEKYDEMEEGFDSDVMKDFRGGHDYDEEEFDDVPLHKNKIDYSNLSTTDSGVTPERHFTDEFIKALKRRNRRQEEGDEFGEMMEESKHVCEQCGSPNLTETECNEFGWKMEGYLHEEDMEVESMMDKVEKVCKEEGEESESCKFHRKAIESGEMTEKLHGKQKNLDKNKNGKIDSEDFKLLRSKKGVSNEGKVRVKGSVTLTEEEMITLIETIVLEEKKMKSMGKPRGLEVYGKAHKGSGKENEENIKSVTKKMKDYLKDGSKGEYSMEPKMFPKGNGQLSKMKSHKYTMSDEGKEFLDDYMRPGMENLSFDEIQPNEEWMEKTIEGSSKTGNSNEYANAEKTDVNKKINKKRKENKLEKVKQAAYRKSKQPVTDGTGDSSGKGINIKAESTEKNEKILNEEFERMKNLISYSRKTQ